jgi:CCR4-NOT transcription complex subunit 9
VFKFEQSTYVATEDNVTTCVTVTPFVLTTMSMGGLISPKPVSYLQHAPQYHPYQRGPSAGYSDTPPLSSAPLAHPVPHQPSGPFLGAALGSNLEHHEDGKIYALVVDLMDPNSREGALLELSKKREQYDDLALVLWHSFGTILLNQFPRRLILTDVVPGIMPALLQEIVSVYPLLSPPNLTAHVSNRVCNALALLQCVASHSETRQSFLNGMLFWCA